MNNHCSLCRHLSIRADGWKWCCKIGMFAGRSVGHCKLKGYKEVTP